MGLNEPQSSIMAPAEFFETCAGFVDDIMAPSDIVQQSKTILARSYEAGRTHVRKATLPKDLNCTSG